MIDLGTGNNNKINWAMEDKQEFIDVVETVYRGARKACSSLRFLLKISKRKPDHDALLGRVTAWWCLRKVQHTAALIKLCAVLFADKPCLPDADYSTKYRY